MSENSVVYEVTRLPRSLDEKPLVLALTSKQSAQRLVAALAEEEGRLDGYKITTFEHPEFPSMRERKTRTYNPVRGKCIALLGHWERGVLTDQQLLAAMWAIRAIRYPEVAV